MYNILTSRRYQVTPRLQRRITAPVSPPSPGESGRNLPSTPSSPHPLPRRRLESSWRRVSSLAPHTRRWRCINASSLGRGRVWSSSSMVQSRAHTGVAALGRWSTVRHASWSYLPWRRVAVAGGGSDLVGCGSGALGGATVIGDGRLIPRCLSLLVAISSVYGVGVYRCGYWCWRSRRQIYG
jgi:hypothetical protein